jgi:hypothetical protein
VGTKPHSWAEMSTLLRRIGVGIEEDNKESRKDVKYLDTNAHEDYPEANSNRALPVNYPVKSYSKDAQKSKQVSSWADALDDEVGQDFHA